jgi:hypothetical protein
MSDSKANKGYIEVVDSFYNTIGSLIAKHREKEDE